MSKKKSKSSKKSRGWLTSHKQYMEWLDQAGMALMEEDYEGALRTCKRILRQLPRSAPERADVYNYMGNAYGMLRRFEESYEAYTQALEIAPNDAYVLYNRALSGRFIARTGQSFLDLERAAKLGSTSQIASKIEEDLAFTRPLVDSELELRGPDFTLEELVKQQEWYQRGLQASTERHWEEAIQFYQRAIDMADCLPSPHGNIGLSLIMLGRYDEAEQALQHALELDPEYEFARRNLRALEKVRETGVPPVFGGLQSPFNDVKLEQSILFVEDDDD